MNNPPAPWYEILRDDTRMRAFGLGTFTCVAGSGARLLTAGSLGAVLWDVTDGRVLGRYPTPEPITAVALSTDGLRAAVATDAYALSLIDLATGEVRPVEPADEDEAPEGELGPDGEWVFVFRPDGAFVLLRGYDASVLVEWKTGRMRTLDVAELGDPVGWSAAGELVCVIEGSVALHAVGPKGLRRKPSRTLELGLEEGPCGMSADGTVLAAPLDGGEYGLFELTTGTTLGTCAAPDDSIYGVFPSRRWCLFTSYPGPMLLGAPTGDASRWTRRDLPGGHPLETENLQTLVSGGLLVVGDSYFGTIRVHDLERDAQLAALGGYLYDYEDSGALVGLGLRPDGSRGVLVGSIADGQNSSTWAQPWDFVRDRPDGAPVRDVGLLTSDVGLLPTGEVVVPRAGGVALRSSDSERVLDAADEYQCTATRTDGTWVAAGGLNGVVQVWDARTGVEIARFTAHSEQILGIAFSPDGALVATSSGDGTLRLWSVSPGTATEVDTLEVGRMLYGVCFSPDGRRVAVGDADGGVSVFSVGDGALLRRVGGGDREVLCPAIHPAGEEIVVGDLGGSLGVYRLADGACVLERSYERGVSAVRFTDGALWVAREDGNIERWPTSENRG